MKIKTIVLSVVMTALLALPTMLSAQGDREGSLFGSQVSKQNSSGLLNQRGNGDGFSLGGAQNEDPTPAPLGSGIAILLTAGAGYVALKKKEDKQ